MHKVHFRSGCTALAFGVASVLSACGSSTDIGVPEANLGSQSATEQAVVSDIGDGLDDGEGLVSNISMASGDGLSRPLHIAGNLVSNTSEGLDGNRLLREGATDAVTGLGNRLAERGNAMDNQGLGLGNVTGAGDRATNPVARVRVLGNTVAGNESGTSRQLADANILGSGASGGQALVGANVLSNAPKTRALINANVLTRQPNNANGITANILSGRQPVQALVGGHNVVSTNPVAVGSQGGQATGGLRQIVNRLR